MLALNCWLSRVHLSHSKAPPKNTFECDMYILLCSHCLCSRSSSMMKSSENLNVHLVCLMQRLTTNAVIFLHILIRERKLFNVFSSFLMCSSQPASCTTAQWPACFYFVQIQENQTGSWHQNTNTLHQTQLRVDPNWVKCIYVALNHKKVVSWHELERV